MTFELSDSLISDIIFAMENQSSDSVLDAKEIRIVSDFEEDYEDISNAPDGEVYSIPRWTSHDGYELLEDFTDNLKSNPARKELRRVLESGRGVFRNFKNVLKDYPEIEKRYFLYKEAKMKQRVQEWYNDLRESWGLQKLELAIADTTEETDELVLADFSFSEYEEKKDKDCILNSSKEALNELCAQMNDLFINDKNIKQAEQALIFLQQEHYHISENANKLGIVSRSISDDFAGCFLVAMHSQFMGKVAVVTDFFVMQEYRGLGVGTQLLSKSLDLLKQKGVDWVLFANVVLPQFLEFTLEDYGICG